MSDGLASPQGGQKASSKRWLKHLVFALLPAVSIFTGLELVLRATEGARPSRESIPLPEEDIGMLRPDAKLMWSLQPSMRRDYAGQKPGYCTNRLGLRYREVSVEKPQGVFRILSLGESTTHGYAVADNETYSEQLEIRLNENSAGQKYQVINAGVPAWSSFQSLLYLREEGIKLQPDMVLFYHEFNDYLPSSWRSAESTRVVDLSKSDREIYESVSGTISRSLLAHSAMFRFVQYGLESYRLQGAATSQQDDDGSQDLSLRVELSEIGIPPRLVDSQDGQKPAVDERQLPRRVSSSERRQNLAELLNFCNANKIKLVVIHPSYRFTKPHECLLTEFCLENDVPMFDAHPSLHRDGSPAEAQFLDHVHPSPQSHAQLASDLFDFLKHKRLLPESSLAAAELRANPIPAIR